MGLGKQVWIKLLVGQKNEYLHNSSWFLSKGVMEDKLVVGGTQLNFAHKGGLPQLIKNPTYPLPRVNRKDIPDFIPLSPYATEEFEIPDIEIHALPYNKKKTILEDHRAVIIDGLTQEGVWNSSPFENTPDTPLVDATGAVYNGYKLVTGKDIINLRKDLNKRYPGLKKAKWTLVLDTDSYWGLAEDDPILKGQMIQKNTNGDVNLKSINYHGFQLEEYDYVPYYNTNGQRLPYGSIPIIGTHFPCATAFVDNKSFCKAIGAVKFFDNKNNSSHQADLGSFLVRGYVGPYSNDLKTNLKFFGGILRKP